MRFRFAATVESLLKDTLQILILSVIVGCPYKVYHWEIEAKVSTRSRHTDSVLTTMTTMTTDTTTATSSPLLESASLGLDAAAVTTTTQNSAVDLTSGAVAATATAAFVAAATDYSPLKADAAAATDLYLGVSSASSASSSSHILLRTEPTEDMENDSNEIDSIEDYVMTEHIVSLAESAAAAGTTTTTTTTTTNTTTTTKATHFNKAQDLSSLSLLSLNETNAPNLRHSEHSEQRHSGYKRSSHGSKSSNATASFQHIGSQRIVLTPTNAIATNVNSSSSSNKSSVVRISAKKVEGKYVLPKPQKTDAPMLNYIFDTFSSANKHHHHDQRYGPHFEDMDIQRMGLPTNMTVQAGSSIHLNCRISLLHDKTVSWVRRNAQGEDALDLLTVGLQTYTGDKRYKMEFQYPNNWRLKITNVKKDDEAVYECQISTHPPRVIQINLHVNAPKVMIVDEFGDPLQEKYYEIDSTLQLSCVVRNVAMATSVVYWKHGEDVLNYDVTRGGVSVKTELMDDGANSTLFIAKINKADSGNYTCSISEFQNFTIVVHILNGESFAELHHGNAPTLQHTLSFNFVLLLLGLFWLPMFINR